MIICDFEIRLIQVRIVKIRTIESHSSKSCVEVNCDGITGNEFRLSDVYNEDVVVAILLLLIKVALSGGWEGGGGIEMHERKKDFKFICSI